MRSAAVLDLVLAVAVTFGFVVLTAVAVARHVADRQTGALELGQLLAVYAAIASVVALGSSRPDPDVAADLAELLNVVGVALLPLLVIRFAAVFDPVPRRLLPVIRRATFPLVLAAAAVITELLPPTVSDVVVAAFVAFWVAVHLVAAWSLLAGGRHAAAAVTRRRSQLMASAVALLGGVFVVAAAEGNLAGGSDATWTLLCALLAVVLFLAGFAPPKVLRWHWSRSDRRSSEAAELRLVDLDEPVELAAELLPHLLRLTGGRAAWLLDRDGAVVASSGTRDGPPRTAGPTPPVGGVVAVHRDHVGGTPVLVAVASNVRLLLAVDPYTLLFGARDLEAVRLLTSRLDVAVDRARLRAREVERVQELADAHRTLEVERLREDVLATVSHELRTPLTTVCGASELLLHRWPEVDDRQRLELVERIAANAEALRGIVQEVLDLIALRVARPASVPRPLAVGTFLAEVVANLGGALADHDLVIDDVGDLEAVVDGEALGRMLEHLLSNAAKFSGPSSRIELRVRTTVRDLVLEVSDEGVGMTRDDLARAFEPFYRSGNVLIRETRGIGLGLAVVAALAETAGVRLNAVSEPGHGTTVTLTVPGAVAAGEVVQRARERHADRPGGPAPVADLQR